MHTIAQMVAQGYRFGAPTQEVEGASASLSWFVITSATCQLSEPWITVQVDLSSSYPWVSTPLVQK